MRDCAGYIWQYMAICPELQKQSMSMPALSISQAHGTSGCRFQTKRTGTNLYQPNPTLMEQLLRKDCFGSSLMADDLRTLLKEAKPGWSAQDNSDLSDSQTFLADPAGHSPIISPKYPKDPQSIPKTSMRPGPVGGPTQADQNWYPKCQGTLTQSEYVRMKMTRKEDEEIVRQFTQRARIHMVNVKTDHKAIGIPKRTFKIQPH